VITALPTGREGGLLALGLALAALAALYVLIALPMENLYAAQAERAEMEHSLLLKLNAVSNEVPQLRSQVSELRAGVDSRRLTLGGASDAIAAAALQGHIEELATGAGVTIGSTEGLPPEAEGAYRRLGLRVVLSGSDAALMKLLAALEAATPPVVIDNLQIHGMQRRIGMPQAALDATLDVFGFRNADEASAEKP
jgi:general secretion pathway protein M